MEAHFIVRIRKYGCAICGAETTGYKVMGAEGTYCRDCAPAASALAENHRARQFAGMVATGVFKLPTKPWKPTPRPAPTAKEKAE